MSTIGGQPPHRWEAGATLTSPPCGWWTCTCGEGAGVGTPSIPDAAAAERAAREHARHATQR